MSIVLLLLRPHSDLKRELSLVTDLYDVLKLIGESVMSVVR